jgi:hypothetical protein
MDGAGAENPGPSMENVSESFELSWSVSPAKLADALAVDVPRLVLLPYDTVSDWESPPAPVTEAVQGSNADPVYVADGGHVTVVVDDAFTMVRLEELL